VHSSLRLAERVQDGPGVTSIRAKYRIPIEKHAAASRPTQLRIILEYLLIGQFLMEQVVAVVHVLGYFAVELLNLLAALRV